MANVYELCVPTPERFNTMCHPWVYTGISIKKKKKAPTPTPLRHRRDQKNPLVRPCERSLLGLTYIHGHPSALIYRNLSPSGGAENPFVNGTPARNWGAIRHPRVAVFVGAGRFMSWVDCHSLVLRITILLREDVKGIPACSDRMCDPRC